MISLVESAPAAALPVTTAEVDVALSIAADVVVAKVVLFHD